jgi:hypothetical protein
MTPKNKERSLSNYSRLANPHSLSSHGGDVLALLNSRQPLNSASLEDIDNHLYIVDKADTLMPYTPNRIQRDLESKLTGRDLVVKPRQVGISTFFVARNFKKAISQRARIGVMAHDDETTQKLRRMAAVFWQNLPSHLQPQRGLDNAKTTSYKATGSEITIATAGSQNVGRGGTYGGGFHGSEVAFWKDAARTMAGVLQGVPLNAPIVLESTCNGASGYFFDCVQEALRGDGIWTVHFYQWWWLDEYRLPVYEALVYNKEEKRLIEEHGLDAEQIQWRRYKIDELGELFYQEYPEDIRTCFLNSGGGVFNPLSKNLHLKDFAPAYDETAYYVAGLDWGQESDYTALSIMRVKTGEPVQEVYLNRWNKQAWASIRASVMEQLEAWHVEKLIPERNSIGSVNIEDLVHELDERKLPTAIQAFYTDQRSKDGLVKNLQSGLNEYGLMLLPLDYAMNELRSYRITKQSTTGLYSYSAPDGGHDDTVMARMLAYYGASQLWI